MGLDPRVGRREIAFEQFDERGMKGRAVVEMQAMRDLVRDDRAAGEARVVGGLGRVPA